MKPLRLHQFGCTVPSSWDRGARTVRFAPTRNRWGASVDGVCPTLWMWWVIHMGAVVAKCWCVYQNKQQVNKGPKGEVWQPRTSASRCSRRAHSVNSYAPAASRRVHSRVPRFCPGGAGLIRWGGSPRPAWYRQERRQSFWGHPCTTPKKTPANDAPRTLP
jgi:hypothetical protein